MNPKLISILFLTLGITACGYFDDDRTAGGGSDQPNELASNEVKGVVLSLDGKVVANSKVILYRKVSSDVLHGYKEVDTATTNANGEYIVRPDSLDHIYGVYAVQNIEGKVGTQSNIKIDSTTKLLGATIIANGMRVQAPTSANLRVQVDTLPIVMDSKQGQLDFLIPEGSHQLLNIDPNSLPTGPITSFTGFKGDTVKLDTLKPTTSQILLDNFEDRDTRTLIGKTFGGGWWYSEASPNAQITPITDAIKDVGGKQFLEVNATIVNPNFPERYAFVGMSLGAGENGCTVSNPDARCFFDLSKIYAISFKARGNGVIRLQLGSKLVYQNRDYHFPFKEVVLDTVWKEYTLPIQSFMVDYNSPLLKAGYTKDQMLQEIYAMSFLMMDAMYLQIDDIRLVGQSIYEIKTSR